jgi:Transposase IS116/IS110/IS902 family
MTPRQNSSGGKERLGRTSKRGDKYIRSLLTAGAVAVLRHARNRPTRDGEWVRALLARNPAKLAAVHWAQDRPHRLGGGDARGRLPGKGGFRAGGITADSSFSCEGEEDVMASGRAADREDPKKSQRKAARSLDRDPISELHQGQRS